VPAVELLRLVDLIMEEQSDLEEEDEDKVDSHADGSSGVVLSFL